MVRLLGVLVLLFTTHVAVNADFLTDDRKEDLNMVEPAEAPIPRNQTVDQAGYESYEEQARKCQPSDEAHRVGLFPFFRTVQKSYYEMNAHMIATHPRISDAGLKRFFRPYDPSPDRLEKAAKRAKKLLEEMDGKGVDLKSLKPREARLISQFQYFLRQTFDSQYQSYFDGLWMIGPDYFCEQTICFVPNHFLAVLRRIRPSRLYDLELLVEWIQLHSQTFSQYLENVKAGPKHGIVFPEEVCKSTAKTFRQSFMAVGRHGPNGTLRMDFLRLLTNKKYYAMVPQSAYDQYKVKYKIDYFDHVKEAAVDYFGKPLHNLMSYLNKEYQDYCVPSTISSGLSNLPLPFVYINGKPGERTDPTLPNGDKIDVAAGYTRMLAYYTTTNITGSEAMDLGHRLVAKYYDQVESLVKDVTKEKDQEEAIKKFKTLLKSSKYFFNSEPFPENETDDDAHKRCDDDKEAKRNCPKRWEAIQRWFKQTIKIMREVTPAIKHLFHFDGPKKTVPDCLVKLKADYNPTSGVPSYLESDEDCSQPASYFIPFFKDKMGPKYEELNTNFHEARPGHHLQIQGFLENFGDHCDSISSWINDLVDYYPAFSEGWGVYAENPLLSNDTDLLEKHDKMQTYGQLKWQIWRALRLIVDVGMHSKNMSRDDALELFHKYTWDDSDTARKEITRYQGNPGQATSYMVGQQTLISFRNRAREQLGDDFDIKDFHYHIISQGQSPFYFLSNYVDSYISCEKKKGGRPGNKDGDYCENTNFRRQKRTRTVHQKLLSQIYSMFRKRVHF